MRSLLGMFGLTGDKVHQDASTLSGGEKTKLALAQLFAGRHNVVLLDEPTNNLDPAARDAVADALAGWPGTIIFVSHDTEFVSQLRPDRVLLMPDGTIRPLERRPAQRRVDGLTGSVTRAANRSAARPNRERKRNTLRDLTLFIQVSRPVALADPDWSRRMPRPGARERDPRPTAAVQSQRNPGRGLAPLYA